MKDQVNLAIICDQIVCFRYWIPSLFDVDLLIVN